jgi:hypothetical protein
MGRGVGSGVVVVFRTRLEPWAPSGTAAVGCVGEGNPVARPAKAREFPGWGPMIERAGARRRRRRHGRE